MGYGEELGRHEPALDERVRELMAEKKQLRDGRRELRNRIKQLESDLAAAMRTIALVKKD